MGPPRERLPKSQTGPLLDEVFEVGRELASGGFVRVRIGFEKTSRDAVVVKSFLTPPDAEDLARLEREVLLLRGWSHPNLARLRGLWFGPDGSPALVYDYCPGDTLRVRSPAGLAQALDWLGGIAAGLDALHQRGICLRDLKPENVVLGPEDRPILVDFGLVRGAGGGGTITAASEMVGTLEYSPPEAFLGEPQGPAGDLYSLGVLAFELLGGALPFRGSPARLASQHLNDPPPPLPANVGPAGPALDRVLGWALAKVPGDRPASAGEFVGGLRRASTGP